jgi:uncharacterized protein
MPDYSYPGVYVEEIGAPREIAGVPTATTAFVGFAPMGPTDRPIIVTSTSDYEATFGKISGAQPLSSGVEDFFANGGRRAVILRIGADSGRGRADALTGNAKAKTGLHALARVEEPVGLLVVPDAAYLPEKDAARVTKAAATLSEANGIFHIADVPNGISGKGHHEAAIRWSKTMARSRNMAIYHPWVGGPKKASKARPPSGVAAGIYARIDQAQGVWKAPAGQAAAALGVTSLAQTVTPADAEMLQGAGINPIRKIAGAGIVVWGAGTFAATAESDWKYVNIRRLFLFLQRSIEEGLSWAVFEPNGEPLWGEIRLEISAFLHTAWRAGALQGATPKDAYFVRCDATTMTQDDIENGRLIASIGVAPLKPAEFVVIRIGIRCT